MNSTKEWKTYSKSEPCQNIRSPSKLPKKLISEQHQSNRLSCRTELHIYIRTDLNNSNTENNYKRASAVQNYTLQYRISTLEAKFKAVSGLLNWLRMPKRIYKTVS